MEKLAFRDSQERMGDVGKMGREENQVCLASLVYPVCLANRVFRASLD